MKETEAGAVKLEGGKEILESVDRILSEAFPSSGIWTHPSVDSQIAPMPSGPGRKPKQKNCSKMPTVVKGRLFRHRPRKIPAHLPTGRPLTRHPDNRHRCRSVRARTGTRDTRHARHQQRILSAVSATAMRTLNRNDVRCIRQLHPRRQGGRLPRAKRSSTDGRIKKSRGAVALRGTIPCSGSAACVTFL